MMDVIVNLVTELIVKMLVVNNEIDAEFIESPEYVSFIL